MSSACSSSEGPSTPPLAVGGGGVGSSGGGNPAVSGSGGASGASVGGAGLGGSGGASAAGTGGAPAGGAGGSTASGGGGGSAGAGGGASGPVKPVMQNDRWAFVIGDVTLEVDPMTGGRITTFSKGAENLLTGPAVNPTYWGSTFWTSPESQWSQPPPAPIDSAPYAVTSSDTQLVLTGQPYATLGVSVTKTFSAEQSPPAFTVKYTLTNTKQTPIMMAPWEVTRVFPRGLTFFPTGSKTMLSTGATLPLTTSDGVTWFKYDMAAVTKDSKLYADGAEGWLAHVAQGLVFIKSFGDVPPANIAPNEGDVELYTNAIHTYIEVENQGPYGAIAANASVSWSVTWYLRALPATIDGTMPSAALAQFVRDTIAGQ